MSSSHGKIITKLHERWQIEADLRKMLSAPTQAEFRRQAQQIASLGPAAVSVIVGNLDRADSRMLTALGTVATFLDHDEIVPVLRGILHQPQHNEQGRMGAVAILERFLGEAVDDSLRPGLSHATTAAVSALDDVLGQAQTNVAVLVEYVQALDHQEPDVVLAVVEALREQPGAQAVEPLRMMAQDVREEIAAEALEALGTIRSPEAARALQTLIPVVGPALRSRADRLLRKLQFSGVEVRSLGTAGTEWRSLLSPVDGLGQQSVWFIQPGPGAGQARFLNVLLSDRAGAVEAAGHQHVSLTLLPPRRSPGYVHDIALPDGSGALLMVEAHFDVGRRRIAEALAHNRETQIPAAGVLRWLNPWLWEYDAAKIPAHTLPGLTAGDAGLLAVSDRLVGHPALLTWTARSELTRHAAEEAARRPNWDLQIWVRRLATELFAEPAVAQVLHRRLVDLGEWLLLAGEESWARMALVVGRAVLEESPQQIPFVRALIRRDLELALVGLEQSPEPGTGSRTVEGGS